MPAIPCPDGKRAPISDALALAGDRLEDEVAGSLVEQGDRRRAREEDPLRDATIDASISRRAPAAARTCPAIAAAKRSRYTARIEFARQVQQALSSKESAPGAWRGSARRRRRRARSRTSCRSTSCSAAEPGDVEVDAAREELDRRPRVVVKLQRIGGLVAADRDHRGKRQGKLSTAMLWAEATIVVRWK